MKEGWKYSTIGDLCNKMNGLWKGKIGPFVNVGVIRNANFTKSFTLSFDNIEYLDVEAKQYKTRKLQKGDLIVEKSGGSEKQPVGRTVLFDKEDGEYSFSNFTSVLRIKDRSVITPEFLYKYILFVYLRGDTRKMQKATTGIHNIEFDKFLSIPVPVLPLYEQQSIVDNLDSAFAKIDAMKANAEKALNEAKALFQKALEEAMISKEGWKEKKLGEICAFRSGFAFKSNKFTESGEPIIRISDIQNEEIDDSNIVYFDPKSYTEDLSKYIIYPNDILIAMSGGTTGKLGINTSNRTFYLNQRVGVFREDKKYLNHRYLFYFLHTKSDESLKIAAGAAQPNLSTAQIKSFDIPFPPLSEQQTIVNTLDSLKSKVDRLQENYDKISQECDALKQAILRQVFE